MQSTPPHTKLELSGLPLVLFDFEHSGDLCKIFLVLLDIAIVAFRLVDVGLEVANAAHLQLVHFPSPIALKFSHIFL